MSNSAIRSKEIADTLVSTAGEIMVAMIQNSKLPPNDVHLHLKKIMAALSTGMTPSPTHEDGSEGSASGAGDMQQGAVPVSKSIKPDYLICLEDGRRFKTLKRHLRQKYNLTPEAYRQKWGLPDDYPMVAPNYSATRSSIARKTGLGKDARSKPKPRKAAVGSATRRRAKAS